MDRKDFVNKEKESFPWKTWVICIFSYRYMKIYFVCICYLNLCKPKGKTNGQINV